MNPRSLDDLSALWLTPSMIRWELALLWHSLLTSMR